MMCRNTCSINCRPNNKCNPMTGECLSENSQIIFDLSGSNTSNNKNNSTISNNIMKLSSERIKAKHWIQVHGNGKLNIKNCTKFNSDTCTTNNNDQTTNSSDLINTNNSNETTNSTANDKIVNLIGKTHQHHVLIHKNNTLMINALNSSIANLTNDVDKLTKQVSDQQTEIKRVTNDVILPNLLPKIGIFLDAPSPTAVIAQISQQQQPIVVATNNNDNNSIPNDVIKQPLNSIVSSNIPTILMPSLSLNQHVGKELHHYHRHNNLSNEKQQHEQIQLSIIETASEIIQQQMDQDSNDNENDNDDDDDVVDGVTELNNNENEIFHVYDNVVNDNNTVVGDTVSI